MSTRLSAKRASCSHWSVPGRIADRAEDILQSLLLKVLRAEEDIRSPGRASLVLPRTRQTRDRYLSQFTVAGRTFAGESDVR